MSEESPNVTEEAALIEKLAADYLEAVQALGAGNVDQAEDLLRSIVRTEPRLPEPQLSLGRLCLDTDRLEEAEERTRTALGLLEENGPWTEDLEPKVVLSVAHAQLAETLRQRLDQDDVVFGDPEAYKAMTKASQEHFAKAHELDPSDETASFYAFYMKDMESDV